MSSPTVNNRGPPSSEHIIGNSKYQTCYPCDNNASSASSKSMEEDDEEPNTITPPQLQQEHAANVGDLMAKAKKAAASLWLILHAQVSYQCGRMHHLLCSHHQVPFFV